MSDPARSLLRSPARPAAALLLGVVALLACTTSEAANSTDSSGDAAMNQSAAISPNQFTTRSESTACAGDNSGLSLPTGFCATIFADSISRARHVVVARNGTVYVNTTRAGRTSRDTVPPRPLIEALRDTDNDGRADVIARFGRTPAPAPPPPPNSPANGPATPVPASATLGAGGTGIAIYRNYLYVEEGSTIARYALPNNSVAPSGQAEVVVSGLPMTGVHTAHPFVIDPRGNLFLTSGSATNVCEGASRSPASPGNNPCTELETRAGIWRFDANKLNQTFSTANRHATGIRNAIGIAVAPDGSLYSTQHGRDQLFELWPKLYTAEQGQNLPAEELLHIQQGGDYGWPVCYFDNAQQKLVLAPEYGGDGGKAVGVCASKAGPVAFFPAHWAPDGLLFYTGTAFPTRYRGGAFIAFHGSWNRAPGPQGGYQVVFVPFSAGKPARTSGFEKFADGFAEGKMTPTGAAHRPVGLAQGPDGALYITDDKGGRVWRVTYGGK